MHNNARGHNEVVKGANVRLAIGVVLTGRRTPAALVSTSGQHRDADVVSARFLPRI